MQMFDVFNRDILLLCEMAANQHVSGFFILKKNPGRSFSVQKDFSFQPYISFK
jgi:hypothetical protein